MEPSAATHGAGFRGVLQAFKEKGCCAARLALAAQVTSATGS